MCETSVFLLNFAKEIISIKFLYNWQELVGSFFGVFLPLLIGFLTYLWRRHAGRKEARKEAMQFAEIYIAQSINHSISLIIQGDAFLQRIEEKISEIESITNDISRFVGKTNFPPIIEISFENDLLKTRIGSYYLHNKFMYIEHIIRFTNCAIKKFDIDYSNLVSQNEVNTTRLTPLEQRNQYVKDLTSYSAMVRAVLDDMRDTGLKLLVQARIYNRKLMEDFKGTKKKYESVTMNEDEMKRIDSLIDIEVQKILSAM